MKIAEKIINGYEDTQMYHYNELTEKFPNSIYYDELENHEVTGVLKANHYVHGRLLQTYSLKENHVGVIAGTRLGKTTSYIIPTILSFGKAKVKRSMLISDPKGELYKYTSQALRNEGYNVLLLNFRDAKHSECWNPLTLIYELYQKIQAVEDEVLVVQTPNGPRNQFHNQIFEDQIELETAIDHDKFLLQQEVGIKIDELATLVCQKTAGAQDPYWEDSARDLFKAFIWALMEDSSEETKNPIYPLITRETCSFSTVIQLLTIFTSNSDLDFDDGFFSSRSDTSLAKRYAKNTVLNNAPNTKRCIVSCLDASMAIFKDTAVCQITRCNSFSLDLLHQDQPIALYIDYKDEVKVHNKVISLFIQDAYRSLIDYANDLPLGKLDIPFYFVIDEFGNFPAMQDFETTISACAGRNIFFILAMQSYAQLNSIYGQGVANIIKDNLSMHLFFGSNNPETLTEFSNECGEYTRISPLSALNGKTTEIEDYRLETIKRVPKSMLANLKSGECVVTEANCGYVLYSMLIRYYECKEFNHLPIEYPSHYQGKVDANDKKYQYILKRNHPFFDEDFWKEE